MTVLPRSWVVPALSQGLVDWAQVIGAMVGVLAFVLAAFAWFKAKKDAAREARRQHELDLLRDIGMTVGKIEVEAQRLERFDEGIFMRQLELTQELRSLLLLVHKREDFPLTRVAVNADASESAARLFASQFPEAPECAVRSDSGDPWALEDSYFRRLQLLARPQGAEASNSILRNELESAVGARIH